MIKLIEIQPRDVYCLLEIRFEDLLKVKKALEMAKIDYNGDIKEEAEAARYLEDSFFPSINEVIRQIVESG